MTKIVNAEYADGKRVRLTFSDGSKGTLDFSKLLEADTSLTRALQEEAEFRRFFLELGALCWPNGLEFSANSLRQRLQRAGNLEDAEVA